MPIGQNTKLIVYIEPITECVRKNGLICKLWFTVLSDLFYDWLNKWPNHDINQSYMVLEGQ